MKTQISALFIASAFVVGCLPQYDRGGLTRQTSNDLQNGVQFLESEFEAAKFSPDQQRATVMNVPETIAMYGNSVRSADVGLRDKAISVRDFLDRAGQLSKLLQEENLDTTSQARFASISKEALQIQALGYVLAQSSNPNDTAGHPFNNAALHYLSHTLADTLGKVKCVTEQASFGAFNGGMVAVGCEVQNSLASLSEAPQTVSKVLEKGAIPSDNFFQVFDDIAAQLQTLIETAQAQKEFRLARKAEKIQSNIEFLRQAVMKVHTSALDAKDQMYRVLGSQVESQARGLLATVTPYLSTGRPIEAKAEDFAPVKTSLLGLAAMIGKRKSTNPFVDTCKSSNPYDCLAIGLRNKPASAMEFSREIEADVNDLTNKTSSLCPVSPLCNQGKKLREQVTMTLNINMLSLQNNVADISANLQTISNLMKTQVATSEAMLRKVK